MAGKTLSRLGMIEQHTQSAKVTIIPGGWLAGSDIEIFGLVVPRPAELDQIRRTPAIG